jgi:hypothetical protein
MERNGWIGEHPWLHWMGDAPYSIYLTHIFSLTREKIFKNYAA